MPPQTSSISVRRVMPIGISTSPTCFSGPCTVIILVPALVDVPIWEYHSPPLLMMARTLAKVSVLLSDSGTLPETLFDRARRLGARLAAHAHDRVHQCRALAADVGAAAGAHPDFDVLPAAEDVLADQTEPLGVGNRLPESLDRQRVLAADVVVCPLGAADHAGDQHPFEDPVRIAFVDAAILVDVRLALVASCSDELGRARALRPLSHLMPAGKPAPPRPRSPAAVTSAMASSASSRRAL